MVSTMRNCFNISLAICIGACLAFGIFGWWLIMRGLPSIKELREMQPTRISKVIAADGSVIGYFPPGGMVILDDQDIPDTLKRAFIAAEDATFYQHTGLDFSRIVSALLSDIKAASYVQGASTITQQVVRTYLLGREKTMYRKLREAILAFRIEQALTKDQILNLYLNRIYLGSGASGVGAAALRYFGKECKDLNLAEMALIAGLAPAPHKYSPLNSFTWSKRRQWYVLSRMTQEGSLKENEAAEAYQAPLRITGKSVAMFTRYPYITDYVKALMIQRYGQDVLNTGIIIKTTISPRLQNVADLAVRKGVIELEMRQGVYRGPYRGLDETQRSNMLAFQKNQIAWEGLDTYQLYWAEVIGVSPLVVNIGTQIVELGPLNYAWINPKGAWDPKGLLRPGDIIRLYYTPGGFLIAQEPFVQSALVAFDVQKSNLLALVGGVDYARNQFNRAIYAKRQSGSAIKPFIYAAALDKGYTPASIILDTPLTYKSDEFDEGWRPKNYENRYFGPTSLRTGLVMSRNVVTVKILKDIGLNYAISYLKQFNMDSQLPRNLSLALGSGVVTPYNLTKAYGTFATYGGLFEPTLIESITTSEGTTLYFKNGENPMPQESVEQSGTIAAAETTTLDSSTLTEENPVQPGIISEQTAYIITNLLADAVREGTAWRVRDLGRPVAGKTGTSDDFKDAWFIGYTPDILCGVWVGYDDMIPLGAQESGAKAAVPLFLDFMQTAVADRPVSDFRVPVGVVFAQVNRKTGLIAANPSADTQFECFKENALPPKEEAATEDLLLKEVF